jgi:homopolymeric O-antigen transport system ATP-binding protein
MTRLAIHAQNVGKKYRIRKNIGQGPQSSLKELLNKPAERIIRRFKRQERYEDAETFWALKDVTFKVDHGESVGLIGRNGAGKSTLLKILSRITRPTSGEILLYERVNSLLEIGTGFNMDLTGRENIFLNGSFLGMKQAEIRKKFDQIVSFSEIEQFLDTPVKYYSSGMFVRLAFSVAVHLTPELLLLDEILSVGDAGFLEKSEEKMRELLGSGATIILVSHDEDAIKTICKRAIWLSHGHIEMDGPSPEVMDCYIQSIHEESKVQ